MGFALDELGADRCRDIAGTLFRVQRDYSGRSTLNGWCPFHEEKNPSFAFNYGEDWYKCRGCGEGGDLVKLWLHVHGGEFVDFKREFCGEDRPAPRPRKEKAARKPAAKEERADPDAFVPEEELERLPPLPEGRIRELQSSRRWSPETVFLLDLREFTDPSGGKRIAIPIRDDEGRLCNIRLYQPGAAEFKVISWWDPVCRSCGGAWRKENGKKVCRKCGGAPNDYGRSRLWPPPSQWKREGVLWLCEGEPDTICALSHGLNACTQTAGAGTWPKGFSNHFKGRDVVIAYDADRPGFEGAMKAGEMIAAAAKSVRVVTWPEGGFGRG